jgi:hypothetical protein
MGALHSRFSQHTGIEEPRTGRDQHDRRADRRLTNRVHLPQSCVDRRSGDLTYIRPGQTFLVARTTAYGIMKVDTLPFVVTMPAHENVFIWPGADGIVVKPREIRIAPYGVVAWVNRSLTDTVDLVFDDPDPVAGGPTYMCDFLNDPAWGGYFGTEPHCDAGNMLLPPDMEGYDGAQTIQIRQFPVPGVYDYHSTRLGLSGRVIVTVDPT